MYLNSKFRFGALPESTGLDLWKQFEVVDLFILAVTSDSTHWFSKAAVKIPKKFTVHFVSSHSRCLEHFLITLEFSDGKSLIWYIYPYSTLIVGSTMILKIGRREMLSTIKDDPPRSLHSYLAEYKDGLFEIIDFLCGFFRGKPTEVIVDEKVERTFYQIRSWSRLKEVPSLKMGECLSCNFLENLISERHDRGLETSLIDAYCRPTLTLRQLLSINFTWGSFNLRELKIDEVIEFVKNNMSRSFDQIKTLIPDFSAEAMQRFKNELGLSDSGSALRQTHHSKAEQPYIDLEFQKFQIEQPDDTFLVFFFLGATEPDCFKKMTVQRWKRIPDIQWLLDLQDLDEFAEFF